MPHQFDNRIDLPAVDGLTSRWAAFETSRREVDLSAAVAQFLLTANLEGVVPLLVTRPEARLSTHLTMEMLRCGGVWLVRQSDGSLLDAQWGAVVASFDEAADRWALAQRQEAAVASTPWEAGVGALGFEVMVHHRATDALRVGGIAEVVVEMLCGERPDCWGSTEPLNRPWDRTELTMAAREHMPSSSYLRGAAPGGARFVLHYERTAAGVTERIRGAVPLGAYADAVPGSVDTSIALLRRIEKEFVVVAGMTTLADYDVDLTQSLRPCRPEVPRALLLGPWSLRQLGVNVAELAADLDAERLGRAAVPSVLFRFDGGPGAQPPWLQLAEVTRRIGFDNAAQVLGAGGFHAA